MELQYPGEPVKKLVLFYCDWFDPKKKRGTRIHPQYGLVQIKHTRKFEKFDPFIFAYQAVQVYYVSYPIKSKNNADWWAVIKTKPRGVVNDQYTLDVAYQPEEASMIPVDDGELIIDLGDINQIIEEIEQEDPNEDNGEAEEDNDEAEEDNEDENEYEDDQENAKYDEEEEDLEEEDGNEDHDESEEDE